MTRSPTQSSSVKGEVDKSSRRQRVVRRKCHYPTGFQNTGGFGRKPLSLCDGGNLVDKQEVNALVLGRKSFVAARDEHGRNIRQSRLACGQDVRINVGTSDRPPPANQVSRPPSAF